METKEKKKDYKMNALEDYQCLFLIASIVEIDVSLAVLVGGVQLLDELFVTALKFELLIQNCQDTGGRGSSATQSLGILVKDRTQN